MSTIPQHDVLDMRQVATQMRRPPMFGALEQRVAWFPEAYDDALGVYARHPIQH
jgi:hypothetical protein